MLILEHLAYFLESCEQLESREFNLPVVNTRYLCVINNSNDFDELIQAFTQVFQSKSSVALVLYLVNVEALGGKDNILSKISTLSQFIAFHIFDPLALHIYDLPLLLKECQVYIHLKPQDQFFFVLQALILNKQVICKKNHPHSSWIHNQVSHLLNDSHPLSAHLIAIEQGQEKKDVHLQIKQRFDQQIIKGFNEAPINKFYLPEISLAIKFFDEGDIEAGVQQTLIIIENEPSQIDKIEILTQKYLNVYGSEKIKPLINLLYSHQSQREKCNYFKAILHLETGELEEALNYFERTLLINPNHIESSQHLQSIQIRLKSRKQKPSILFNTLPKSGSVFITQNLRMGLDLDFFYLSSALFANDILNPFQVEKFFEQRGTISQAHLFPSPINLNIFNLYFEKIVIHVRDPRQALLSWVHHVINYKDNEFIIKKLDINKELPTDYFELNLTEQLNWMIQHYYPLIVKWVVDWYRTSLSPLFKVNILFTRYDDFCHEPIKFYNQILAFYELDPAEFKKPDLQAQKGKFHYRKGQIDEWRSVFTSQQIERVNALIDEESWDFFNWHKT